MKENDLIAGEVLFARSGGMLVAASRALPIVSETVACIAGIARMPFLLFALALVCGAAPLGLIVAAIGYTGSERPLATLVACALLPMPV